MGNVRGMRLHRRACGWFCWNHHGFAVWSRWEVTDAEGQAGEWRVQNAVTKATAPTCYLFFYPVLIRMLVEISASDSIC